MLGPDRAARRPLRAGEKPSKSLTQEPIWPNRWQQTTASGRYYKQTLVPHQIVGPFYIYGIPVVPFAQVTGSARRSAFA
jgi:hypothetical protein